MTEQQKISIFFDLETSDLSPIGQILNYAFVAIDENFQVIDSLSDIVKISRLQLPRAGAVFANKTNVIEHQARAVLSEYQAIGKIDQFLVALTKRYPKATITLVGYNSSEFDLGYLRTVAIRNGINPYWPRIVNQDLLLLARHLLAANDDFREVFFKSSLGDNEKYSLRLERLCQMFGLLEGQQLHESLFDVNLTIELAKVFLNRFNADIRDFEPYQLRQLHSLPRGTKVVLGEPVRKGYGLDRRLECFEATLLDSSDRAALWVNLDLLREQQKSGEPIKRAVKWLKFADSLYQSVGDPVLGDPEAIEALARLEGVTLKSFFERPECYLEQHIYRFNINKIGLLKSALASGQPPTDKDADLHTLFRRFRIENSPNLDVADIRGSFERYVRLRYGGKMLLSRSKEGNFFYPTYDELLSEITKPLETPGDLEAADREILGALKSFYKSSEIHEVLDRSAGEDSLQVSKECGGQI